MKATDTDYTQLLQALLPPGAAWPRDAEATLTKLMQAYADELARAHNRAVDLTGEADPRTATETIGDWETTLGLPDPCMAGIAQTLTERQAAAHAKLIARGGQSRQFFIDLAKAVGFDIAITEFKPFRAGISRAGDPACSTDWRFAWQVNAPEETIKPFTAGEALRNWGNALLECVINQRCPAHTHVQFTYGG